MGEYLFRRACGKKVKGQTDAGEWLCGVHLGAYNRVKKNDAESESPRGRQPCGKGSGIEPDPCD